MMKKKPTKFHPILLPILGVIAFVCFACLNLRTSIWFDEAYSSYIIRGNYAEIWEMTSIDVHPPFYYYCLKTWSLIFGTSDFAIRSMSVFFAAIGIVLAYFLLRRWFGERTAGFSTVLLSLSPFLIRYAQEARMYGLVFAIVMGATLLLDMALKTKKKAYWAGYAVLVSLGMWTHYFCALAWLAHVVYIIYYMRKHGLQKSVFWAYPLSVALYLPWIPTLLHQFMDVQGGFWIPEVSFATLVSVFTLGLANEEPEAAHGWMALLLAATIIVITTLVFKVWGSIKKSDKQSLTFIFAMWVLPVVFLILLSLPPFKPTFVARYVTYSLALMMPIIGYFVTNGRSVKPKYLATAALILTVICAGIGIYNVDTRDNDNATRGVIAAIQEKSDSSAPILVDVDEMDYYNVFFYETERNPIYGVNIDFKWGSLEPIRKYGQNYTDDITAKIADVDTFWYMNSSSAEQPSLEGFAIAEKFESDGYVGYKLAKEDAK